MKKDPIDIAAAVTSLRALANPARLRIALQLLKGEQAVSELETELEIKQPTLSQHLAELREAGLVATRRESRIIFYQLADQTQLHLIGSLLHSFGGASPMRPIPPLPAARKRMTPAATFAVVEPPQ
jgi:DNA-binding transcriptional ArsR family regulator